MGFKVEEVVDKLDYDFRPFVKGVRATGVIPEPSSDQIDALRKLITEYMPTDKDGKVEMEEMEKKLNEPDAEDRLYQGISDFTSNRITVETLREFASKSPRGFKAFVGWLVGKFFANPEA